jgi:YVTN family beta-propeller protein
MLNKLYYFCLISTIIMVGFTGCSNEPTDTESDNIDANNNGFETREVAEVIVNNCATSGCHSGSSPSSSLALNTQSNLLKGSSNRSNGLIPNYGGDVVIPFRLEESLLYQFILGNVTPLSPHDAINLTQSQIDLVKAWLENGAKDNNGNVPLQSPSYNVYVCNQNSDKVSIINGDAKVVSSIVDVNYSEATDSPHMVKEKGNYFYVTLIASSKFLKIDKTTKQIVSAVDNITKAGMIQILPDGSKAYVSRSSTSDPIFNSVYSIDLAGMTIIKEILFPAPGVPHGMGLKPDGTKLYVANLTLDRIHIVNTSNDEYTDDIVLPPGTQPMQAAVSPDGNYLYVSARGTAKLLVFDTATDTMITEVDVSPMPMQIAITSNGEKIYFGSMMMSVVNVVRHQNNTWILEKSISHPGFSRLHGCDITADDKYVYVSSRNEVPGGFKPYFEVGGEQAPGTIGIIDTQTDEVIKFIEIEQFGSGLVVEK